MASEPAEADSQFSAVGFILKSLGLFLLVVPIVSVLKLPIVMEGSDYAMNFYIAGRLILTGHASDLYPSASETTFLTTSFNRTAHALLPHLAADHISIYMYNPLIALLFAPYGALPAQISMAAWQLTSVAAFFACAYLIHLATGSTMSANLRHATFYLPVFHTLLIGHIGITMGLLPLCGGYLLLARARPFLAGMVWSLLSLKPQYLPVVLLIAGAFFLNRQWRLTAGLVSGALITAIFTVVCLTPQLSLRWLSTLRLSDTLFSDPHYGYPTYLICSLPAAILHFFPIASRNLVKIPAYLLALGISLHALFICWRLVKSESSQSERDQSDKSQSDKSIDGSASDKSPQPEKDNTTLMLLLLMGISVLPLVLPHFLYYDLSIFSLFGMIANNLKWNENERPMLISNHWLYLVGLNIYMILFLSPVKWLSQPMVLVAMMGFLYWRLVRIVVTRTTSNQIDGGASLNV